MKKFSQLMIVTGVVFACSTVYAATVNFPAGQSNGTFACTVSDPTATVKIDTDQVDIGGGCGGNPYVTSPGHLDKMPASLFETYYFGITKHLHENGQVTLTTSSGDISCETGHGGKPQEFGDKKYCLSK